MVLFYDYTSVVFYIPDPRYKRTDNRKTSRFWSSVIAGVDCRIFFCGLFQFVEFPFGNDTGANQQHEMSLSALGL